MKVITSCLIVGLLVTACAGTTMKINKVSLGMTKAEVIKVMEEEPYSTAAQDNVEYLKYYLKYGAWDVIAFDKYPEFYFIRLVDGKVESFGKMGDFDSTKVPETKKEIDLNIDSK